MGGVQEIWILVGPSWTTVRLVGTEATVMKIEHGVGASLNIHMGTCFDTILSSKTCDAFVGFPIMRLMHTLIKCSAKSLWLILP